MPRQPHAAEFAYGTKEWPPYVFKAYPKMVDHPDKTKGRVTVQSQEEEMAILGAPSAPVAVPTKTETENQMLRSALNEANNQMEELREQMAKMEATQRAFLDAQAQRQPAQSEKPTPQAGTMASLRKN